MEQGNAKTYLAIMLTLSAVIAAVGYVLTFLYMNLPCYSSLRNHGFFIGYCETERFGDFEHGAIVYNFEPGFTENVRRADVLFLGESRLQTAVSTGAVGDYFHAKGLRFYDFGFGFGESAGFPMAMLDRIGAHPTAVVINADGFFKDKMSDVAAALIGDDGATRLETYLRYQPKYLFQTFQTRICAFDSRLCAYAPAPRSWARSVEDGHWIWISGDPDGSVRRITADRDRRNDAAELMRQRETARRVLTHLRIPNDCIILTGVPNPISNAEGTAASLAAELHLPLAQPDVKGLATRDESHLNRESADRWSAALIRVIDPLLDKCRAERGTSSDL